MIAELTKRGLTVYCRSNIPINVAFYRITKKYDLQAHCMLTHDLMESPPKFNYSQIRKEKISIKTLKAKENVCCNQIRVFEFGSRLCKGKVLAPLKSIVLKGNHLVRFAIGKLDLFIFSLQVTKSSK